MKVALIAQCYTSNPGNSSDLASLVPVYARLARDFPSVIAILTFSGSGRPTGLNDHPEIQPLWDELAAGIPSAPPPEFPVATAKATIESFETPILLSGNSRAVRKVTQGNPTHIRWQYSDDGGATFKTALNKEGKPAENPVADPDHHYTFPRVGSFNIRIQTLVNGVVTDTSNSFTRVVTVKSADPEPPDPEPIPPEPLPPGTGRTGIPRGNGFQVIDDDGGYLPIGTSFFWGNGGWLRERSRCQDNLNWAAGARIDFVRVIATGLKMGTNERSVSPKDPAFSSTIAGLTDACRALGMRVQWTIFGATYDAPTKADRQHAVDLLCDALKGHESSVQMIEIANEGWQNGFEGDAGRDELKDLVARVKSYLPQTLVAPTCPKPGDDVTPDKIKYYYAGSQATIQTHHYARATNAPDGVWRPTRKPWRESNFAVPGCPLLVQNGEPRGPDSSGTQTHDPLVLAMDACTTWLCGVGSYVLHTGAGIFGVVDPAHGRPANLWETQNIDAICSAIRTTRSLLPADLPNFTKHQANASSNPFTFVDVPDEQFTLAYAATSGNRIVQGVGGVVKATTFTLRTGTCAGKLYNPVTGQVIEVFDKSYHTDPSKPGVIAIATRT